MSIELTKYEQSKLNAQIRLEAAKKEFEASLTKEISEQIINKKRLKKSAKIKEAKTKAKRQAKNIIKSIDNGFQF